MLTFLGYLKQGFYLMKKEENKYNNNKKIPMSSHRKSKITLGTLETDCIVCVLHCVHGSKETATVLALASAGTDLIQSKTIFKDFFFYGGASFSKIIA